jgi:membrane dipeptidase
MNEEQARALHAESLVVDAVCPLAQGNGRFLDWYREGGVKVLAPTVGSTETPKAVFNELGTWHRLLRERGDLQLVSTSAEVESALATKRLGLYFHIQGADPIENSLDLVDAYKSLGVGVVQLTYNIKNRVGDGCEERTDSGLSKFGVKLVERLNRCRVIVDCSHTGSRTSLDAIECSKGPVVLSHSNLVSVHRSARNASDELVSAIAKSGGLVGMVGFPAMVSASKTPTLDDFIDHIDAVVKLVGIDHVGLGLDYYLNQAGVAEDDVAMKGYRAAIASGVWGDAYPPPPHHYPDGINTPRTLPNFTIRLSQRGYSAADIRKVLGENWLRVMRAVWG